MKIKLLDKPDKRIHPKVQCCLNRGIPIDDIQTYLTNTFDNILPYSAFDEKLLNAGAKMLINAIANNKRIWLPVDSDVDGFTSAALFINYLYETFPAWTANNVDWSLHPGKGHGLGDFIDTIEDMGYTLAVCIDSSTNDIKEIERLHNVNCGVLILDHHLSDVPLSPYAITINSQYDYPNKELSGVGVVYKFCKYLDSLLGKDIADNFLDLVAVGLQSDMMDIRSLETKELIFKGFQYDAISNPLIYNLFKKSEYACSKADYTTSAHNNLELSPMACSFFITPLLNSVCRSGTKDEKSLTFKAMLTMEAFKNIPSTKRGHKVGELETVVTQMTRQLTNIKNRQTRAEDAGIELLTAKADQMLDDKVLIFALEPGQIEPNIAGLVANKMMARYQRPVCVVTHLPDNTYVGSMRGYTATGIDNFKAVAESSEYCAWSRGHENAAGICITDIDSFKNDMNNALKDVSTDIVYYVDYIYHNGDIDGDAIIAMAELNDYLGQGFFRPQVYVESIKVDNTNLTVMKGNTLKIHTPNCDIIKFGGEDDEIELLSGGVTLNIVCKPVINEWLGNRNPQLICIDYEIVQETPKTLIEQWNF